MCSKHIVKVKDKIPSHCSDQPQVTSALWTHSNEYCYHKYCALIFMADLTNPLIIFIIAW